MTPNPALEAALALSRAPNLARAMRSRPLPEGLTFLLRMLSGELEALAEAQRLTRLDQDFIIAVAEFYVLRVMLFRGASSRRILGADPGMPRSQIRLHMGYLMSWLHPDRSGSSWRAVFARRVLDAWRQIEKGAEEVGVRPRPPGNRDRRTRFPIPWIAVPSQSAASVRFLGVWRRLVRWSFDSRP
jgi:hypothetical protein